MKRRWAFAATIAGIVILLCAGLARLWSCGERRPALRVVVPFAFRVGMKPFTADEYVIERINPLILRIRLVKGGEETLISTTPVVSWEVPKGDKVAFEEAQGEYFFAEVWWDGLNRGSALQRPKSLPLSRIEIRAQASGSDKY